MGTTGIGLAGLGIVTCWTRVLVTIQALEQLEAIVDDDNGAAIAFLIAWPGWGASATFQ